MDWRPFTWKDNSRSTNTLNVGMILGFITFNDDKFPTPCRADGDTLATSVDNNLYVVARCSPSYQNFDKECVTEVELVPGKDSVFIVPVHDLVGPACIVSDTFNLFRMR